jgi:hypothetical protein
MKYVNIITKLADIFEEKLLKQSQEITQTGTTELFFDDDQKQIAYGNSIRNEKGPVFKILNNYAMTTGNECSLDVKIIAEPNKGASWNIYVNPVSLKSKIEPILDAEFRKIMHTSMLAKQKQADVAAKQGAGSGELNVADIILEF